MVVKLRSISLRESVNRSSMRALNSLELCNLERARKLFAISFVNNNSAEEVAIASRRLRKLMDDNDIGLSELKDVHSCDLHSKVGIDVKSCY